MKVLLHDEEIGEILYEESIWTGKKTIYINGKPLEKVNKSTFSMMDGEEKKLVSVRGNIYQGISLVVKGKSLVVSKKPEWYEIAFSILPFAIVIVWGNNATLCSIVPIIGGAIGGAISGAMGVVSLSLMQNAKEVWKKLLIGIGMLVGTLVICFMIAAALVSALN